MAWLFIMIAGFCEIGWAVGLKYTVGFSRLWPSVGTVAAMAASVYFLALGAKTLPMGTAYAVWTGIGAAGTVIYGMVFWHEPCEALRVACLLMIVAGIVGLKFFGSH